MRIIYFLVVLTGLCVSGCDKPSSAPSGCCAFPAIEATVGNGHVYVPNVFTPDGNGINDILTIFSDGSIIDVSSMEVFDVNHHRVFSALNFLPNDPSKGWDGTENGHLLKGVFDVIVEVEAIDHTVKTLSGKVCSYPCAGYGNDPASSSGCQFPAQANSGHFDPTLLTFEDGGCFE